MATQAKMPERIFAGVTRHTSLDTLFNERRKRAITDDSYYAPGRHVCGYTLPSWQRGLKWSTEQCIRFIESAWLGLHLGTWVSNAMDWASDDARAHSLSGILIDGQQRFHALDQYWADAFPVFGHIWSELDKVEQRRFLSRPFASTEVAIWDDRPLRELYDRLNFGGTAHEDSERAVNRDEAPFVA